MHIILALFITFLLTYLLVPLNIIYSKKIGMIDYPHQRGMHEVATPLAGGLALGIPLILMQIYGYFIFGPQMLYLAAGSFLMLLLGFLDDKTKFTARFKLFFQIAIVTLLYFWGFQIELITNPFGDSINLGIFSYPVTLIWFLVVINAFNLIDGLDGLAAGIAVISAGTIFIIGYLTHNEIILFLALILIGANLAFLRYNFSPAKIFMGDTGSLLVGFNLAALSIAGEGEFKGITSMTLLVPIMILGFPLLDIVLAVLRRLKKQENIFQADKEHIHHKLHNLGISQKYVALICYFITFLFSLIGLGFALSSKKYLMVVLLFLLVLLLILTYNFFKKDKQE
ncbi:MAG: MraY family glycosyltransferase [Candidatus Cloacimonadales bacterium]